ncbi:DUF1218 domain-containing protein [Cephalotus follicularis]|uniref:DUF1218 domain-containing protein n=1 Tax=Cephalotus follicularis TaxID=3775 RepID=A0A1Q3BTG5_CEPFO|nr:DUF1218 domain-containing protein [Cephalotus follicularis]
MAKNVGYMVCLLVMAMDIAAGILGIKAEIAEHKMTHLGLSIFECGEASHKAYKLGLDAAILLAIAHVIANFHGGCIGIWYRESYGKASTYKQLAVSTLIFSWLTVAAGLSLLIIATLGNSKPVISCGISHHRFFSIGGILCFIHGFFTTVYCAAATAVVHREHKQSHATVT